jgi:head-tail adaptor
MRAGQLDRLITFERPVFTGEDSEYGVQPTGEWENAFPELPRIPAQVMDDLPSKSEAVLGGFTLADRPARVRVRYMRGIDSTMRVVVHEEEDEIYQITGGPAEIGRREWTELTVKAFTT